MKIAITGATGHIGTNLVRVLLARGHRLRVLIHSSHDALDGADVERLQGDIRDTAAVERLCDGVEVVFHLAALISIEGDRGGRVSSINVEGPRNVARAARRAGVRRMVHVSSVHAFRHVHGALVDETSPRVAQDDRFFAYDRSKAAGEIEVRREVERGLDAVVAHPSGVVGPYDHAPSRMGRVIRLLARGLLPIVIPGAYDFVDVRDVTSGLLAALEHGRTGESYLLTGHRVSIREMAERVATITGQRRPWFTVPAPLARFVAPAGARAARLVGAEPLFTRESLSVISSNVSFDRGKAARELGYVPRPFDDTLADTVRWHEVARTGDRVATESAFRSLSPEDP